MSFQLSYTDASGNTSASSYWRATQVNINALGETIYVGFTGWKDQAAHDAGLAPLSGASRGYSLTGSDFETVGMEPPVGSTLYDVIANAAETYALAAKDAKDSNGNAVSFFAGATRIA